MLIHISRPVKVLLRRAFVGVLVIVALFGIFINRHDGEFSVSMRNKVADGIAPVLEAVAAPFNFVADFGNSMKKYLLIKSRNDDLEKENLELRKQLIKLVGVASENDNLKKLLNVTKELKYGYKTVRVVGEMSGQFQNSVIVNAGEGEGMKKGMAVVNNFGLVGRIVEVGEKTSRVLLLTDINSNVPVIAAAAREHSIMSGDNSDSPQLLYLPTDSKIQNGEVLLTSGDGGIFPPDLQVGIADVKENGVYRVNLYADEHRLEYLSVIDYAE